MAGMATHHRRAGRESEFAMGQRLKREAQRLTVRCADCPWHYTGPTITAVRRAQEHRASSHPDRPVVTPPLLPKSAYCKVEGCRELAASRQGRYARLCAAHREEALVLAAAPRPARAAVPSAPRRPRAAPRGRGYVKLDPTVCKVAGCAGVPVRMRGMLAGLCEAHATAKRDAEYGPRPQPPGALRRHSTKPKLDPTHCKVEGCDLPPRQLRGSLAGLCPTHAAARSEVLYRSEGGPCSVAGCTEPWVRPAGKGAHLCRGHLEARYPPRVRTERTVYRGRFTPAMQAAATTLLCGDISCRQLSEAAYTAWGFTHYKHLERLLYGLRDAAGLPAGLRPRGIPVYNRAEVAAMVAAAVHG